MTKSVSSNAVAQKKTELYHFQPTYPFTLTEGAFKRLFTLRYDQMQVWKDSCSLDSNNLLAECAWIGKPRSSSMFLLVILSKGNHSNCLLELMTLDQLVTWWRTQETARDPENTVVNSTSTLQCFVFCVFFMGILVLYQNTSPISLTWSSSNENRTNLEDTYYFLNQVDETNPALLCSFQRKHVSKIVLCLAFLYNFCGSSQKTTMWQKWITNTSDLCVNVSGTIYEARIILDPGNVNPVVQYGTLQFQT